ncbi:MAG: trigger factor [Candidatus Muirbacterium halophilum]|nr:trigger factor [Candidatus Muirbacterium halophilum]MCK9474585.1 trigger factor [Candidatus Muirbacterium halophilum]
MQINEIERNGKEGKVSYKVTLPVKKVDEAIERVYKDLMKRISIPGFRKGKVPKKVLEVRVGKEYFEEETKRILVEESYYDAVKNIDVKTLDQHVDDVELKQGEDFSYIIKVDTVPEQEIDSSKYKGIKIEFKEEVFSDEKVQKNIESFYKTHATYEENNDSAIEDTDVVGLDFLGKVDGVAFEGGESKDYSLTIGSGSFIDNFEQQLIGMKVGNKKEVHVKFPDDYREGKLAGKPAVFDVEIKSIKKVVMPEINEEFLKKVGFDSEQAIKEEYIKKTKDNIEKNNKANLDGNIIEAVVKNVEPKVPETMVQFFIDRHVQEFEQNIKRYFPNISMEDYLKATQTDMENLRENYRNSATKQAEVDFLLKNIARQENIIINDEDRELKFDKMASMMNQDKERLKEVIIKQGNLPMVDEEILLEKTLEFLKNNADIN